MKIKFLFGLILFLMLASVSFFSINFIYAQSSEDNITDSFEDSASLNNYEHSQDVVLSNGSVKINTGNMLFRLGIFSKPVISLKVRFDMQSAMLLHYHASDKGSYGVEIINSAENISMSSIRLFKEAAGQRTDIGSGSISNIKINEWNNLQVDFSGNNHIVIVNDETIIDIEDTDKLASGGIGIVSVGEKPIEIDDLSIKSSSMAANELQNGEKEPEPPAEEQTGEQISQEVETANEDNGIDGPATSETTSITSDDRDWKGLVSQLFISGVTPVDLKTFLINLVLSALFSYILGLVYIYWGASLSNRRKFASNFILLTVTTTFIILVVRSSVALSLGLVGALSIVRFRAAIKEPEELAFLFLAIGLGIGLGDNQRLITTIAFAVAIAILGLLKLFRRSQADVNMHLNISLSGPGKITIDQVKQALKPFCSKLKLLRFDENDKMLELSFIVEFKTLNDLNAARDAIVKLSGGINITFLDNKGIW